MIFRAKYVLDYELQPRENFAVHIEGGRIVAVGPFRGGDADTVVDLGDVLLGPGFVNAHTHLELGFAAGAAPPAGDFVDWLRRLLPLLLRPGVDEAAARGARDGLRACLEAGTTLVGDITRDPYAVRPVIAAANPRPAVVSFGEVLAFGALLPRADERIIAAFDSRWAGGDLHIGVSPHATYTVEAGVLESCLGHAAAQGAPVCIHAAESREEERYTFYGDGPLRDFFVEIGLWQPTMTPLGCRPVEYLARNGALRSTTLLAHCNYVSDAEIERLAASGTSVAYCPRTHAAFGHPPHRFREMLARGVHVCLGTDSLASNPDLSILEEMRFLRRHHDDLDASTIFTLATCAGAKALGFGEITGKLQAGMRADLVAVPLDPQGLPDPRENVLRSALEPGACVVAGKLVDPDVAFRNVGE